MCNQVVWLLQLLLMHLYASCTQIAAFLIYLYALCARIAALNSSIIAYMEDYFLYFQRKRTGLHFLTDEVQPAMLAAFYRCQYILQPVSNI